MGLPGDGERPAMEGGLCAKIDVVQTRASGQAFVQSGLTGSSGQHGMFSAICMPGMELDMSSVIDAPEDAMALPASPMLIGPTTIASMVKSKNRRWTARRRVMARYWHGASWNGSGVHGDVSWSRRRT
ncbi:hypothetical protein ACOJBM_16905 [Rhizobium beringeri]